MPIVTSQPASATEAASTTAASNSVGTEDDVVRGERGDQCVGVLALEHRGGQPDRGHRVAG